MDLQAGGAGPVLRWFHFLISGDKDLLTLGQFGGTTILTWDKAAESFAPGE